jgi:hypothetical protein
MRARDEIQEPFLRELTGGIVARRDRAASFSAMRRPLPVCEA